MDGRYSLVVCSLTGVIIGKCRYGTFKIRQDISLDVLSSALHTVRSQIFISQQVHRLLHPTAAKPEQQTCNLRPARAALPLLSTGARLSRA